MILELAVGRLPISNSVNAFTQNGSRMVELMLKDIQVMRYTFVWLISDKDPSFADDKASSASTLDIKFTFC